VSFPLPYRALAAVALCALAAAQTLAQGTFGNLDFENATIVYDPSGPYRNSIYASNAIPCWTAYLGGVARRDVTYNSRTLDAADVSLHGVASSAWHPIQGNFSVLLLGSSPAAPFASAAVGQTGQLPTNALSLVFLTSPEYLLQVTFGGQPISLVQIGSTATNITLAGDISAFAGQTGELRFTAPAVTGYGMVDDIRFSNEAIPEPSACALFVCGAVMVGVNWWRRRR
jgi:hypothetical protein